MKIASMPDNTDKQTDCKNEWIERAKAVGLTSASSQSQVMKAEKKEK